MFGNYFFVYLEQNYTYYDNKSYINAVLLWQSKCQTFAQTAC